MMITGPLGLLLALLSWGFSPQEAAKSVVVAFPAATSSVPVAPRHSVASVAEQKPAKAIKATVELAGSAVEPRGEPGDVPVLTQISTNVNNAMPQDAEKPQDPQPVGKTTRGWDVFKGTGAYAVDPDTGSRWSAVRNPNGTWRTVALILK